MEKYIEECLNSIINQDTKYHYHVICVNDGSTDNTPKLLEKYERENNIAVIHQGNRGVAGGRNIGIKRAEGKYLMFVDADDRIPSNAIEDLLSCAFLHNADICGGGYFSMKQNGRISRYFKHPEGKIYNYEKLFGFPWGKVIKKDFFERILFPEGYWYEDSIMQQLIYPMANNIYGINKAVYYYRKNPYGITLGGSKRKKSLDSLWITLALYQDRKNLGIPTDQKYYEYLLLMVCLTYRRIEMVASEKVKQDVLIVFSDFFNRNLKGFFTKNNADLEYAVKNNLYSLYKKYCEMIK